PEGPRPGHGAAGRPGGDDAARHARAGRFRRGRDPGCRSRPWRRRLRRLTGRVPGPGGPAAPRAAHPSPRPGTHRSAAFADGDGGSGSSRWYPMSELFSYDFMQRALLAAVLVGMVAPLVGVFLVQRRLSLVGDGMGHVALAGVAVGLLTNLSPVWAALVAAVLAAVAIELIRASGP